MTGRQSEELRIETSQKRVRALFAGEMVADSTRALLVWERPHYPKYYVPGADVRTDLIVPSGRAKEWHGVGEGTVGTLRVNGREAEEAVLTFPESPVPELAGAVRLRWSDMDAWFEEDEEVFVHPRDPHVRVDVLASSRHVRVRAGDVTVAESSRPMVLFETGLPPRYYLPKTDVRLDLLEPSDSHTQCPYKGTADYYSLRIGDKRYPDVMWTYRTPLAEVAKIAGLIAFYDHKVDVEVTVPR